MPTMEQFDEHAVAARRDQPPLVDVTQAVMAEVHAADPFERRRTMVLYTMTALSAAAAVIVAAVAINLYDRFTDPLVNVFVASTRIMP